MLCNDIVVSIDEINFDYVLKSIEYFGENNSINFGSDLEWVLFLVLGM